MTENTYVYKSLSGRIARLELPYDDAIAPRSLYVNTAITDDGEYYQLVVPVTEPLGMGAVLLDNNGTQWVRVEPSTYQDKWPWVNKDADYVSWSAIANPTVLSEGYLA